MESWGERKPSTAPLKRLQLQSPRAGVARVPPPPTPNFLLCIWSQNISPITAMICVIFRCLLAVNKDLIWTYHNPNCPMRLSLISDSDCLCRIRGGSWFVACTGIMVCVERSLLRIWIFFWDVWCIFRKKERKKKTEFLTLLWCAWGKDDSEIMRQPMRAPIVTRGFIH